MVSVKPKPLCPRCGLPGTGPYVYWVLNSRLRRYEPYRRFAHYDRETRRLSWCHLGKRELGEKDPQRASQGCPRCAAAMVPHRRLKGVLICPQCWFKLDAETGEQVVSIHKGATVARGRVERRLANPPSINPPTRGRGTGSLGPCAVCRKPVRPSHRNPATFTEDGEPAHRRCLTT